jgi:hypothetical protein
MALNSRTGYHEITLDGTTVCRDGEQVEVVYWPGVGKVRIGCTTVNVEVLRHLLNKVDAYKPEPSRITFQEGQR